MNVGIVTTCAQPDQILVARAYAVQHLDWKANCASLGATLAGLRRPPRARQQWAAAAGYARRQRGEGLLAAAQAAEQAGQPGAAGRRRLAAVRSDPRLLVGPGAGRIFAGSLAGLFSHPRWR